MPFSADIDRVYDDAGHPVWTIEQCHKIGQMLDDTMEIAEQRHRLLHRTVSAIQTCIQNCGEIAKRILQVQ